MPDRLFWAGDDGSDAGDDDGEDESNAAAPGPDEGAPRH
jgi:hypothetical protein